MSKLLYPARIWKEDNVYYVQFKNLENGFTFGNTLEKAKEMAVDVLSSLLSFYLEHNKPIPSARLAKGKDIYLIAPDAKVQAALLLRLARASTSQNKIAKTMGTTWQAYQKIESPRSNTTLNKLQKAAKASNKRLVIEFMDDSRELHEI
jgi:antitoxin HicB